VRPVISITVAGDHVIAKNIGSGPALNLKYVHYEGVSKMTSKTYPIVGIGECVDAGIETNLIYSQLDKDPMTYGVEYESLGGIKYKSEASWIKSAQQSSDKLEIKLHIARLN
jgi:hypothetical protein